VIVGHESERNREVRRDDLIVRVLAADPALLVLTAPAGFGKSTFARQAISAATCVGIADCSDARRADDLARGVLAGLADAFPENRREFAGPDSALSDPGVSLEERLSALLAVWREPRAPSTIVFENAEHATRGEARDLLARLLAARPANRRVVLCTREPLRLHVSRFAAPHQILTLRAADLAFNEEEVRRVFGTRPVSPEQLKRVVRVSRGWPIAVLLYARFADEGRLEAMLDQSDVLAFEELHEYLIDQVLAAMPPSMRDALLFCSAAPNVTPLDIEAAFGPVAAETFEWLALESPFVEKRSGVYEVHPLAVSALRAVAAHRLERIVRAAADSYVAHRDARNAARMFLVLDDPQAAALELNRVDISDLDVELVRMKSVLPNSVQRRFPNVWGGAALLRLFQAPIDEMREEGEAVWNACTAEIPIGTKLNIGYIRVLHEQYAGRFPEAMVLLEELEAIIGRWPQAGAGTAEGQLHQVALACLTFFRGMVFARCGSIRAGEVAIGLVDPAVAPSLIASGMHCIAGADIARVRGERTVEREQIERARAIAAEAGYSNYVALYTAEAAIGAWLAGEDDTMARHIAELDELVERDGVFAFGFLAAMFRGREREPRAADFPKYVCFGHLIAAAKADESGRRDRSLGDALATAARFGSPMMIVLTALAAAMPATGAERARLFERARAAAAALDDAPALNAAVADAEAGGAGGFLAVYLARYRRAERSGAREVLPRIRFADGRVLRDGAEVRLGAVVEALLFALAEDPRGLPVSTLMTRMWPGLDVDGARNSLKVTLWRLRKGLGDVTVRADNRVGLTNVQVDLWEAEAIYRSARDAVDPTRREELLREALVRLEGRRPPLFEEWEWFEPIARRIDERRAEIATQLARLAMARGDAGAAQALGESIAAYDPLDEVAQEIVVRALLVRGDRAEALRRFRRYRVALRMELDCDPSPAFARLFQPHAVSASGV
jgi:DNA-binding SARP family transcriptional activator